MKIKEINSREDVAEFLNISDKGLRYALHGKGLSSFYDTFTVEKHDGSVRMINAPKGALKVYQKRIAEALTDIYMERPRKSAIGFIPEKSIVDGAKVHLDAEGVLNIDLKDFFNQVHFGRVKGLFERGLNIGEEGAITLAKIVTLNGVLPQGAPSSPIITNMICSTLDWQLERFANKYKLRYTRYVDDITFSSKKKIPKDVCHISEDRIMLGEELKKILKKHNFLVNENKIFLNYKNTRQEVTGLVINEKINVRREFLRNLRVKLYNFEMEIKKGSIIKPIERNKAQGRINYIGMIRGKDDPYYIKYALQFNKMFGEVFDRVEQQHNFDEWIRRRVFAVDTYEKFEIDDKQSEKYFISKIMTTILNKIKKNTNKNVEKKYEYQDGVGNGTCFQIQGIGIVSCYHVLENIIDTDIHELTLYEENCTSFNHKFVYDIIYDSTDDVAVIENSYFNEYCFEVNYNFNYSSKEEIYLVGFPNYDFKKISPLIIKKATDYSMRHHLGKYIYEVDVTIAHGYSGGPVLDKQGRVVGIVTDGSGIGQHETPIYGFVPIKYIKNLQDNMK